MPSPSCLRLLVQWMRRAASRADWTAGRSRAINTAMIAITTSSSISVKPERVRLAGAEMIMRSTSSGRLEARVLVSQNQGERESHPEGDVDRRREGESSERDVAPGREEERAERDVS